MVEGWKRQLKGEGRRGKTECLYAPDCLVYRPKMVSQDCVQEVQRAGRALGLVKRVKAEPRGG